MEERMDFRILNNGSFIPSIGYGTYKTDTEGETEQAVCNALGVGYRLLDTAAYYGNEEAVGRGIKASALIVQISLLLQKFGIPTQDTIIQCALLKTL